MVAMDVKTSIEKYPILAGLGKDDYGKRALNLDSNTINKMMDNVKESIKIIMENKIQYEFRTTVIKQLHSKEDFEEIGKLINGAENYFIQSYRHASEEASASDIFSAYDKDELEMFANIVKKYVKNVKVRGI
jgi:pyruvate formate lyase activating enzyme